MKTNEELHKEAAQNLRAIHATYFHKDCFAICIAVIVGAIILALFI